MIKSKLVYLALLIALTVFYVLYIDSLPLMMLGAALIVPLILKICLLVLHGSASADISCQMETCSAGETVPVTVTVRNRSRLSFPCGEARVRISHSFGTGREVIRLRFPVQDQNSTRLTFYIGADSCGTLTVSLHRVYVFDHFRLFHTKLSGKSRKLQLLVLPKPVLLPLDASAPPVENPESLRYADKPGDDPSELFGIREYRDDDPVSRIHWKLSSRSDTLLVKEFGSPVDKHALLLAEYRAPSDRQQALRDADALLTLLYSLSCQLIEAVHPVTIAWFDRRRGEVIQQSPADKSELAGTFRQLYMSLPYLGADAEAFRTALGAVKYSSAHVFTNVPDTVMPGIAEHSIAANHRTFYLVPECGTAPTSEETDILPMRAEALETQHIIV